MPERLLRNIPVPLQQGRAILSCLFVVMSLLALLSIPEVHPQDVYKYIWREQVLDLYPDTSSIFLRSSLHKSGLTFHLQRLFLMPLIYCGESWSDLRHHQVICLSFPLLPSNLCLWIPLLTPPSPRL